MDISTEEITYFATDKGIHDVRFACADDFRTSTFYGRTSPRALLEDAACIIILFTQYLPAGPPPPGSISLSAYYVASNIGYHAARQLTPYLQSRGAKAVHTVDLPSRAAALRTGGLIGDNGFYYHPNLGSFVSIQTIVTNAALPLTNGIGENPTACRHCGACKRACPSGAVGNIQNCLRYHINGHIPQAIRGDVYQLFGCEKCQSACPLNPSGQSKPYTYRVGNLLSGMHTKEIKSLAGVNLVRHNRLVSQAALFSANNELAEVTEQISTLAKSASEPVREHAIWALDKLQTYKNGEKNDYTQRIR